MLAVPAARGRGAARLHQPSPAVVTDRGRGGARRPCRRDAPSRRCLRCTAAPSPPCGRARPGAGPGRRPTCWCRAIAGHGGGRARGRLRAAADGRPGHRRRGGGARRLARHQRGRGARPRWTRWRASTAPGPPTWWSPSARASAAAATRSARSWWTRSPPPDTSDISSIAGSWRRRRRAARASVPGSASTLPGANRDQLILAGVDETRIHTCGLCTAMHPDGADVVPRGGRSGGTAGGRDRGNVRPAAGVISTYTRPDSTLEAV